MQVRSFLLTLGLGMAAGGTVEETVTCGGVLLRLIDTAGIRDTADAVEQTITDAVQKLKP